MRNFRDTRPGEVVVHTSPNYLQVAFARVKPVLRAAQAAGYDTSRVFLILDEVLSNVYRHGYRRATGLPIGVQVGVDGSRCHITVRDLAPRFDSAGHAATRELPALESGAPGGRGLVIVHRMCESLRYRAPAEGGNELELVMQLVRRFDPQVADSAAVGETVCRTEEDDGVAENR